MTVNYSFETLIVNGREIKLVDIIHQIEKPLSSFEASAFSFIQQWFSRVDGFTQMTSGSTGPPKAITITRDQMVASALLTKHALNLNSGDTAFICLDPAYIAGKMMLARSFTIDMKIVLSNPSTNPFGGLQEKKLDFAA